MNVPSSREKEKKRRKGPTKAEQIQEERFEEGTLVSKLKRSRSPSRKAVGKGREKAKRSLKEGGVGQHPR